MSELIGKEVLNKVDIEDNVIRQVTVANDVIGGSAAARGIDWQPTSIADVPTELTPTITRKIPTIAFIIGGLILIYFLFRSK